MAFLSFPKSIGLMTTVFLSAFEGLLITLALGIIQVQVEVQIGGPQSGLVRSWFGMPFPWREVSVWSKCEGIDCLTSVPQFGIGTVNWSFLIFDFSIITALAFFVVLTYWKLVRT